MRYRGFDRRTRPLRWGLFGLAVAAALVITGPAALHTAATWVAAEQDRLPWYTTRVSGFAAYGALTASVLYGLLLSTGILDALAHRAVSFSLHQEFAAFGIALTLVHGAALTLDHTMPFSALQLLVPFAGPYRPLWVGLGQVALLATIAVYGSFSLRKRIGQRTWRRVHYLTFLGWSFAAVHGLMSGSDSSAPWALWTYVATTAAVVFLLAYRVIRTVGDRMTRPNIEGA
jgi:DMSO/TMAO reductase YedYZ heme-binding membrane subunit